jgi:hypothetical protein
MKKNKNLTGSENVMSSELAMIDSLEIAPLSDEELDSVAGGETDTTTVQSCSCCAAGATIQKSPLEAT